MTELEARAAVDTAAWGDKHVHDPTIVTDDDGTYWLFSTDARYDGPVRGGVQIRRSTDLVTWEFHGWAFDDVPAPARAWSGAVGLWAPEVVLTATPAGQRWRMYYSASTFGSRRSAVGLATAPHPSGPWTDRGIVVASEHVEGPEGLGQPNAIDANLVTEADGTQWLVYGSFFGGIHVLPVDPVTGFVPDAPASGALHTTPGTLLARRPRSVDNGAVEGAFVLPRPGGGWSLLVSYDSLAGSYHLRAAVGDAVTGPFRDRAGRLMTDDGPDVDPWSVGVPVLSGHRLAGGPGVLAPGHASVLTETVTTANGPVTRQLLVHHVRDADAPTEHRLQVRRLVWTHDGWPLAAPQPWAGAALEDDDVAHWPADPAVLDGTWETLTPGADPRVVQDGVVGPLPPRTDVRPRGQGRFTWTAPDGAAVSAVVYPGWDAVRERATLCLSALDDAGRVALATRLP